MPHVKSTTSQPVTDVSGVQAQRPLGLLSKLLTEILRNGILAEAMLEDGFLRRFAQVGHAAGLESTAVAKQVLQSRMEGLTQAAGQSVLSGRRQAHSRPPTFTVRHEQ